jgi:hypothetical protein
VNGTKLTDKDLVHSFMEEFVSGMANVGDIWGAGLGVEPPRSTSKSAWLDVSRSFRATGNNLRWAITTMDSNE